MQYFECTEYYIYENYFFYENWMKMENDIRNFTDNVFYVGNPIMNIIIIYIY